ncbi:MAG: EamA family transporter [bacterium]
MDWQLLAGLATGCAASLCMNVGKGVQKMKVRVLAQGRAAFAGKNRRDLAVWTFGVLMTASATVLFSKALQMTDKPSIVSSLNGVGLIGLALFSHFILKERVGRREVAAVGLIIAGTALVQFFNVKPEGGQAYSFQWLLRCAGGAAAVFAVLIIPAVKTGRGFAFTFGALAGTLIGFALMLGDIALIESGGDFLGQLRNPYPYVAVPTGALAMAVTQVAFFRGSAVFVVPTINSFIIIVPMVMEVFIFGAALVFLQYAGAAAIVAGIVTLTTPGKQPDVSPRGGVC